jgi:hypothetical protein
MFKNKELLSRPERISTDVIKSVFYEIDNRVFCIIFSISTTILKKIKNKLFDDELFISSLDLSHMVDSDLFYWLLYKYEYNDKIIDTNFEIEAIEGFIGNIADDNNIIKGTSEVTPSLLVTKAFVSKFHPITNLNMILKFEDYKLSFMINTTCQCLLSSTCIIPNIKYDVDISALIILYADIIPKLIEDYELEKTKDIWNREIKKSFAKKVGIDVIRDIAKFHDIKISINEESKTQALG